MNTIVQLENSIKNVLEQSDSPLEDILQLAIVERWDNRYKRAAVVHMDWHDEEYYYKWLVIEFAHRLTPRLKTIIEDIREIFPGMQTQDILNGLYRFY